MKTSRARSRSTIPTLGGGARAVGSTGATAMSSRRNGKPRVGKQLMKSHRKISLATALLAALVAVAPASAAANSLLSGYGGPGAGNQAILGSALIGGGGSAGGGGSSGSSGSGSTGSTGSSTGSTGSSAGSTGSSAGSAAGSEAAGGGEAGSSGRGAREEGAAGNGAAGKAAGDVTGSRRGHGKASGGAARAYPVRPLDDAAKPTFAGSGVLGFSAADFGYLLLVVAVLGATGFITRRLVRALTPAGGPTATGKGP
jgi:hypothetical protein